MHGRIEIVSLFTDFLKQLESIEAVHDYLSLYRHKRSFLKYRREK